LDPKILWKDDVARIAFKQFDTDGSGMTNVTELNESLAPLFKVKTHVWEKVLGLQPDENINFSINYEEFRRCIKRAFTQ